MSWLGGYKPKKSAAEIREEKRKQLEADRLARAQRRAEQNKQLQAAQESQQEADEALKQLQQLAPEIFEDDNSVAGSDIPDSILDDSETDNDTMAGDEIVDFEDENGTDDAKALQEAIRALERLQWEDDDIDFFFNQAEIKMAAHGVKKNYTKFQVLATIVPSKVTLQVKSLLRKKESEYPNKNAYKMLKNEILRIFGPKPEAGLERALTRVLTDTPSALARLLVNDLCKTELQGCTCCPGIITGLWKRQLPSSVTAGIAGKTLTKDNFNEVCQHADDIFASNPKPTVAAITNLNETQPAIPYATGEVAAVTRGGRGGRGNRGNRGNRGGRGGRGGSAGAAPPRHKGTKHPDLPDGDWKGCQMHFKWGKGAYFCSEPASCPWKNVIATKPNK